MSVATWIVFLVRYYARGNGDNILGDPCSGIVPHSLTYLSCHLDLTNLIYKNINTKNT